MSRDCIESIGDSLVHHGPFNDRAYVLKLNLRDVVGDMERIELLSQANGYSKIVVKTPEPALAIIGDLGYEAEALIPRFYQREQDMAFMSKFLFPERGSIDQASKVEKVLETAELKDCPEVPITLKEGFSWGKADHSHAAEMARLYRRVFETYPFPVHEKDYIIKTMDENLIYFYIADHEDQIVSVSSLEVDREGKNAEMTDFATIPEYRGKGFASFLLLQMEKEMHKLKLAKAFTIARAVSYGMNITFAKCGFEYCGTLVNNTNISGDLESMNVWHKDI